MNMVSSSAIVSHALLCSTSGAYPPYHTSSIHNLASDGINEYSYQRRTSVIHCYLREKTCKRRYIVMMLKHVIGHAGTLISYAKVRHRLVES